MMDNVVGAKDRTVDPILNIPVNSPLTSLCFVSHKKCDVISAKYNGQATKGHPDNQTENVENSDGTDQSYESDDAECDDDDDEMMFRSSTIRLKKSGSEYFHRSLHRVLDDRFLASCHSDGEALLWDLNNQKRVATIAAPRGGSGLCVRRTDDPTQIIFQTRDPKGIVSLHSIERCPGGEHGDSTSINPTTIRQYETYSHTFCQAAPCYGNKNLIALPSNDDSTVTVVDDRSNSNVAKYSIAGHGMLTSLAFSVTANETDQSSRKTILACGMENGTAILFDITNGSARPVSESSFSLGKDPILTLDIMPSRSVTDKSASSFPTRSSLLVAAGMAGDAEDVAELSKEEAGRAVLFKAVYCHGDDSGDPSWKFKQRSRLSTCRVDRESFNGKPGVSTCRFRHNDGRLLAIGGWDRRIRLFERSKGKLMAILKGNPGSVTDLDWAPDAMISGLLASASRNEKLISIWQCYANS